MNTVLQKVIEMSIYGSLAILLVMLFRLIFRKFSKKLTLLFWVIVAIRLLCPINFSSPMSLMNLVPQKTEVQEVKVVNKTSRPVVHTENIPTQYETVTDNTPAQERALKLQKEDIMPVIWIGGMAVLFSYSVVKYIKVNRFAEKCKRTSDGLFLESDRIETPFVAGIINTRICIPSHIDNSEKEYLLLHEKIHIKNHDGIIKTLGFLVVCIHWFNPLVWLSYILLCSDLEMRCDEEVVETLGRDIKKDYCLSIIMHSVKEPMTITGNVAFSGPRFGAMEVKMRIKNLLNYKKVSKTASVIILCLTFGVTSVLTACASKKVESTEISTEATVSEITGNAEMTEVTISETAGESVETEEVGFTAPVPQTPVISFSSYDYSDDEMYSKYAEELINEGYQYEGGLTVSSYEGDKFYLLFSKDDLYATISKGASGYYDVAEPPAFLTEVGSTTVERHEDGNYDFAWYMEEDELLADGWVYTKDHIMVATYYGVEVFDV